MKRRVTRLEAVVSRLIADLDSRSAIQNLTSTVVKLSTSSSDSGWYHSAALDRRNSDSQAVRCPNADLLNHNMP